MNWAGGCKWAAAEALCRIRNLPLLTTDLRPVDRGATPAPSQKTS